MIECLDCGHVGDAFESTRQLDTKEVKFILACSQCDSLNVKRKKK